MTPKWIFGYGSLVWRPAFAHLERRGAVLEGWGRRFWQGSTDHRGVPGEPGRVVTLVPEPLERCWGVAYRLAPGAAESVLEALDHRERGGYARMQAELHFPEEPQRRVEALVYRATPDNPNYLGPAPLDEIAAHISRCRGPSGSNREYLLQLAGALRELGAEDEHVFALESLLRSRFET